MDVKWKEYRTLAERSSLITITCIGSRIKIALVLWRASITLTWTRGRGRARCWWAICHSRIGQTMTYLCAREAVGNEPFLLMLGDHLYRSTGEVSCAQQLIEAYDKHAISVLGLRLTPEDQIANFGTATGVWIEDNRLLNITEFAEKPTVDYAQNNLRVSGLPQDEYLTVFGQYAIKPQLFDYLEEHIANNVRERGEFQLTSALDRLRQEDGFLGLIMDGQRYDIGLPEYYLQTLRTFRQE
ncbi:MAG: sugar phosphate nucleotidyltransferase [Anaerolineae bacterium]